MPAETSQPVIVNEWNASFHLIETPFGLIIDSLHIKGNRAKISPDPVSVELERDGEWEAFIEEAAVQMLLEQKAPAELRNVKSELLIGKIRVTGSVKLIVELPVEALCTLAIRESKQIWVELESVNVAGVGGKSLVEKQLEKVNPILDVNDLPLNLRFSSVEIQEGEIRVTGTLAP